MPQQVIKKCLWRHADGQEQHFVLTKHGKADFRWIVTATGAEWDKIAYLEEADAVKKMRLFVETDPTCVGVDMTLSGVEPTPEQRAADCIDKVFNAGLTGQEYRERCAEIIASETNLPALTTAFSELLAYVMIHRPAFARALFPVTPQGEPRDLVLDGLLYAAIEAMQKSTGQDFGNMLKRLKEPVSQIMVAKGMPKFKGKVQ